MTTLKFSEVSQEALENMKRAYLERNSTYNLTCYLVDNGKSDTELGQAWMKRYQDALINFDIASKQFENEVVKPAMKEKPYTSWEVAFGEDKIHIY